MAGTGDKRVERSKAAVMAETYRQLTASGLSGVSIDEVARNSGVAKTTIYRHWPSRSALLIDACSQIGAPQAAPDSGNVRDDLLVLASTVADQLQNAAWPSVLPSIIDAAEREPEVAAMFESMHEANMAPFRAVLHRAADRGQISPEAPIGDLVAALVGPLFYRRWFSKETIEDPFVESVVDAVVQSARAVTPPPGATRSSTRRSPTRKSR